ncbi:phage major capsid protein [Bradyrhizobium liaoningense]|uniref:phage major capsid protein n=1 Tax=Bradyrhizobium liaoningense TaxID=43992 RepID=UPI001BAAE3BA|nr:phage major capsid protein [Bradyrhizobium liaoningense]MBR0823750.1 phage major capsid protein [Bradyrhizobium liaoningense]
MSALTDPYELKRAISDVQSKISRLDHRLQHAASGAPGDDRSLITRIAACLLLGRSQKRSAGALAAQLWPHDLELKAAVSPAMTSVSGWAGELVGSLVQDLASRMLPSSCFSQLRTTGLSYDLTEGGVVKVPSHLSAPSGSFVGEGQPIPVASLLISSLTLLPKKVASITSATRETLSGSAASVETSLQAILTEDMTLALDTVLLDATAADAIRPAGLRYGAAGLTPAAVGSGNTIDRCLTDLRTLVAAIAPALRPVLIVAPAQAVAGSLLADSMSAVIVAPFLTTGTVICVDAASFASVLGPPDLLSSEESVIHEVDAATQPIGSVGSPAVVAAPSRSLFQTAAIGLRVLIDANWALRRTNSVAWMSSVSW